MYPSSIENLINCFKMLPGIGEKTAERLTFSLINMDNEKVLSFADALKNIKKDLKRCSICNNICDGDICNICSSNLRSKDIIFVVEKPKDIMLFEKLNIYKGTYHVLDGLISPLEGINPADINLKSLISRIDAGNIKEVIMALKPSIEGETTMQYIKKILENKNIKITKLATGVPVGTDIEFIDSLTLEMSLSDRKEIS